ncbi:paraquat-inducible protein A [Falsigemmobacter faecalis]|uniref:Paraquat-inducible membrane protein A n=1 Tax=Falsigemmobacter faecalis TaxID=2488730 RepID=A0A3P3D1I5_9RHOB|nr:paraquat-inducible protein A [Falsigemmobacter faecalis]RRH68317.1 paraquat-inducible membrane protein A [Falsigemmobacter faecalis]
MADARTTQPVLTAREAGWCGCRECGRLNLPDAAVCTLCGMRLQKDPNLQAVWAWLAAGVVAYIPANLYPMLRTSTLGRQQDSTIVAGAIELAEMGSWGVAAIVLIASVLIPVSKFLVIAYLAVTVQRGWPVRGHLRYRLYEVVEFVGRWSMIDVFVVAILSALVRFNMAATIAPGVAAFSFALSVIFTMLAAQNFDPRLLWMTRGPKTA